MMDTYRLGENLRSGRPILDEFLMEYAKENPDFYLITPDIARAALPRFMNTLPKRQFNVGIAEMGAIELASGMAVEGLTPVVYGMAAFLVMRACESIRTNVCYQNHKVIMIGNNTGLSPNSCGSTHYAMEDIAIMGSMPNLTLLVPGDPDQTIDAFRAALDVPGPVYIRMANGRNESAVYKNPPPFEVGKGLVIKEGGDGCVIACGVMVSYALEAARLLEEKGIHITVVDIRSLKPIDKELIVSLGQKFKKIVTVEDHLASCGMGSMVSAVIAENGLPCQIKRMGIPDCYPGFGKFTEQIKHLGYDTEAIMKALTE